RRFLVLLSTIQGLAFFPLAWVATGNSELGLPILFVSVTIYWLCAMAGGASWNSWMSHLVPRRIRSKHLAQRSYLGQISLFIGLIGGGLLLQGSGQFGWGNTAFAFVFGIAGLSRLASAYLLSKKSEPADLTRHQTNVSVVDLIRRLRTSAEGRLVGFLLVFSMATNVAAPFFNPYMLKHLSLPYYQYVLMIAAGFMAKIVVFSAARDLSSRISSTAFIRAGVIGASVLPVLWLFSSNVFYLFAVNLLSGAVWAVFDLGVMVSLFGAIKDNEKTSFLSYYNFASAVCLTVGAFVGGKLLSWMGDSYHGYFLVFAICAVCRFLGLIAFDRLQEATQLTKSTDIAVSLARSATSQVSKGLRGLSSPKKSA
ncbi:MAG TPA: hypothetical protein VM432_04565, partial [Bdellovibrionales bacterium]|nr:hypothetical protein [Bdellovibrionales bacterium]